MHNKCNALESSRNRPPNPSPWKNCFPQNWSLVPKRLGAAGLRDKNYKTALKSTCLKKLNKGRNLKYIRFSILRKKITSPKTSLHIQGNSWDFRSSPKFLQRRTFERIAEKFWKLRNMCPIKLWYLKQWGFGPDGNLRRDGRMGVQKHTCVGWNSCGLIHMVAGEVESATETPGARLVFDP